MPASGLKKIKLLTSSGNVVSPSSTQNTTAMDKLDAIKTL